jgi:hypothetical protein
MALLFEHYEHAHPIGVLPAQGIGGTVTNLRCECASGVCYANSMIGIEYFYPKSINSKSVTNVLIIGIMFTPWGAWKQAVAASGGHHNCARD